MMRSNLILPLLFAVVAFGQPARDRHVIVISLDGFPNYALNDPTVPLPVLRKLIREGASADGLKSVNAVLGLPLAAFL